MIQEVEIQLVQKLKNQDLSALGEIYELLSKKIYNRCFFILKNQDAAEDATQDVFLKLFTYAKSLKDDTKLEAWLNRIAYNYCIDLIKKARKSTSNIEDITNHSDLVNFIEEVDELSESEELQAQLKAEMALLSEKERLIIILYYWEGMKISEISKQLSLGESAVKMQLSRTKGKLKEKLKSKGLNYSMEIAILLILELI